MTGPDVIARAEELLNQPTACDSGDCSHDYKAHCDDSLQSIEVGRDLLRALVEECKAANADREELARARSWLRIHPDQKLSDVTQGMPKLLAEAERLRAELAGISDESRGHLSALRMIAAERDRLLVERDRLRILAAQAADLLDTLMREGQPSELAALIRVKLGGCE